MSVDRESLRETAKYLQNVRPVDPEEVYEYLPSQPHPAVVRRALREEAFSLGFREREDGSFVPISEDPVDQPGWEPTQYPPQYDRAVADRLVERYGRDWETGESGHRLRERIRELKETYYRGEQASYDEEAALAYAIYHGADFYAATGYALDPLTERGLLPRRLRVLDVGAGTGSPAVALHDYLPEDAVVDYHAVEPSANADVLEAVLAETGRNFRTTIHRTTAEAFDPGSVGERSEDDNDGSNHDDERHGRDESGGYDEGDGHDEGRSRDGPVDLLLFGNVLSELAEPAATVERYCDALASDGSCLLLAPADLETATGLRSVERTVATPDSELTVYAPTLRLWPGQTPSDRGWSFDERPPLAEPPPTQRRLADTAEPDEFPDRDDLDPEQFRNTSVRFAYAILRRDGERRLPVRASADRHARLADSETHVTGRVNTMVVKLSRNLAGDDVPRDEVQRDGVPRDGVQRDGVPRNGVQRDGPVEDSEGTAGGERLASDAEATAGSGDDRNPVYRVGDGSQSVDHYAVLTRRSSLNGDLQTAPYGAVLSIENVLVLWNDDERAYNLVCDAETVVDLVG